MGTCLSYLSHRETLKELELDQSPIPPHYAECDPLLPAVRSSAPPPHYTSIPP